MPSRRKLDVFCAAAALFVNLFVPHQPAAQSPAGPVDGPHVRPIVVDVPGMATIRATRDVAYSRAHEELTLDVSLPEVARGPRPAVFFVHGGPVRAGADPKDWAVFRSYGALAAASGFAGVTFNHRFHAAGDLAIAETDVRDAIAFVRTNAERFEIDPQRIAIWAYSGGGTLASFALREPPPYIKALVFYYARLDMHELLEARGSDAAAPPLLIARAGRDDAALNQSIDRFVSAALRANRSLTLLTHPLGRHGFDYLDADARSRDIIAQTIAFLQTTTCDGQCVAQIVNASLLNTTRSGWLAQ